MSVRCSFSKCTILIFLLHISYCAFGKPKDIGKNIPIPKPEDLKYSWLEFNDDFDSMVGISINGKPVCSGVIVSQTLILSAANPIERVTDVNTVKVHVIDGHPDKQKVLDVKFITRDQSQRNTGNVWTTFGYDNLFAPHHDVIVLTVSSMDTVITHKSRFPRSATTLDVERFDETKTFSFAGFGFIDKPHVRQNVQLELVEYLVAEGLERCEEFMPLSWGHFICLANIEHFVGISSGAGLFYNGYHTGIGSFSLKRGNESILVFTDLRPYYRNYGLYYTDN